jgi:uncharacterized protein (DUF2147 family)
VNNAWCLIKAKIQDYDVQFRKDNGLPTVQEDAAAAEAAKDAAADEAGAEGDHDENPTPKKRARVRKPAASQGAKPRGKAATVAAGKPARARAGKKQNTRGPAMTPAPLLGLFDDEDEADAGNSGEEQSKEAGPVKLEPIEDEAVMSGEV